MIDGTIHWKETQEQGEKQAWDEEHAFNSVHVEFQVL